MYATKSGNIDLNDLRTFAQIVECGGYTAAERVTRMHRSQLSRRIAALEARLGVRLLNRTTRRLSLTEAGSAFYAHCAAVVAEAEAATRAIAQLQAEPSGTLRMTCPVVLGQLHLARLVGEFVARHPRVRVDLDCTDRVVPMIEERIDIALRARGAGLLDPGLVARKIASSQLMLVASADYLSRRGAPDNPLMLAEHDTIAAVSEGGTVLWTLTQADGTQQRVSHTPRVSCSDFVMQCAAAEAGAGIALIPLQIAAPAFACGRLQPVLADWRTEPQPIHLVMVSRRGLLPAVRTMMDFLVERLPPMIDAAAAPSAPPLLWPAEKMLPQRQYPA